LRPRSSAGSADAIYQNLNILHDARPDHILVFGAGHICRVGPRQMLAQHVASGAGVTVAALRVPKTQAHEFGIIEAEPGGPIEQFREKPTEVEGLADEPDSVFASMGNYIFRTTTLIDALRLDAADESSRHDIGGDLIPPLVEAR